MPSVVDGLVRWVGSGSPGPWVGIWSARRERPIHTKNARTNGIAISTAMIGEARIDSDMRRSTRKLIQYMTFVYPLPRAAKRRGSSVFGGLDARLEERLGVLGPHTRLDHAPPLELRVQLGAEQHREVGDPEPDQKGDRTPEGAVGLVVRGEARDVQGEAG